MKTAMWIGVLVTAMMISGCTASADITNKYKDADRRYSNQVGGQEVSEKTVDVPAGVTKLVVKAAYNVGGQAAFILKDPSGTVIKNDNVNGGVSKDDDNWYSKSTPTPGTYKLSININGGATYAFGFYY
jgi:hypothetical protein